MKTSELAIRDVHGEVIPPSEIQQTVIDDATKVTPHGFLVSMIGGGLMGITASIPFLAVGSIANIAPDDFLFTNIINAVTLAGCVFGFRRSAQFMSFLEIEERIKKQTGVKELGKFKTASVKRTLKEKRVSLPIEKGFKTEKGKEVLGAMLVTNRAGIRVELSLRENPLITWDDSIATVKKVYAL